MAREKETQPSPPVPAEAVIVRVSRNDVDCGGAVDEEVLASMASHLLLLKLWLADLCISLPFGLLGRLGLGIRWRYRGSLSLDLLLSVVRCPHSSAIMKQSSNSRPRDGVELQHIMVAKGPMESRKELLCCGSTGISSDQEHQVSCMAR